MGLPTFNSFSLQDQNFITERVVFRGYADRAVIRAKVNRREGIKLVATEFGEKEVTVEGVVIAESASHLQSLLDNMKVALSAEEGPLIIDAGRQYRATVTQIGVGDEHYNQSKAPYSITFLCSDPFSEGDQLTSIQTVPSGIFTFSGTVNISGTFFGRPVLTYTPPTGKTGPTQIKKLVITHTPSGQSTTVSGFGSGTSLRYQDPVTINMEDFTSTEGGAAIENTGSFPRWEPGINTYTATVSGGRYPGGTMQLVYKPRYL